MKEKRVRTPRQIRTEVALSVMIAGILGMMIVLVVAGVVIGRAP